MSPTRSRPRHGTVVAYLALFLALGGTGWAASQSGSLKIRCSATKAGKKVRCTVVSGKAAKRGPVGPAGPRGPQGAQGPAGPAGAPGAAGDTVFTQSPAYAFYGNVSQTFNANPGQEQHDGFAQGFQYNGQLNASSNNIVTNYQMFLSSMSKVAGSDTHIKSVQFCYGTSPTGAGSTAKITITGASVVEFDEPANIFAKPANPQPTETTLFSTPLSLANQADCLSIGPPSPAAINPDGYLAFRLSTRFDAPAKQNALLWLGRVTVTYSP